MAQVVARGVKFIRWDRDLIVDQVRSVCVTDVETGCWIWNYGGHTRDYPEIMIDRRRNSVARLILEVVTGESADVARHRCDNPPCCRPDHLEWGTTQDNVADRVARGRSARGERSPFITQPDKYRGENHWTRKNPGAIRRGASHSRTGREAPWAQGDRNPAHSHPEKRPTGEGHGLHKLTESQVAEIRALHAQGATGYRLAKQFLVSKRTIQQIVRRVTWRHVA